MEKTETDEVRNRLKDDVQMSFVEKFYYFFIKKEQEEQL